MTFPPCFLLEPGLGARGALQAPVASQNPLGASANPTPLAFAPACAAVATSAHKPALARKRGGRDPAPQGQGAYTRSGSQSHMGREHIPGAGANHARAGSIYPDSLRRSPTTAKQRSARNLASHRGPNDVQTVLAMFERGHAILPSSAAAYARRSADMKE
eukprot:1186062-Prorocentrum_minimum.AAC.6